ncbi:MAG TPA: hypothetical protein VNJ46_10370 [Gaiellaceae bacterium]|nr:hypothetical protein [Gaiellaceae bacterium]
MALLAALVSLGLLGGSALLLASALRVTGAARRLLAAYVLAVGEVVGLVLLLSSSHSLTRSALLVGLAFLAAASGGAWLLAGGPRGARRGGAPIRALLAVRPVAALATLVLGAYAYVAALVVGTPPNGWDQLVYHLARAALWLQAHAVAYVQHAYDERINFNPPNGEIALAFALGTAGHERAAGAVQLVAALACALGVYVLARALGLRASEAAYGGLLFLTLPIVVLQAASAKNDLVVASLLLAAAVFALGSTRADLALAALAAALAVGAKFTAPYGLVFVFVLALLARSPRPRWERLTALGLGSAAGAYWYLVNVVHTGSALGDQSGTPGLTAILRPRENLVTAWGFVVDLLDVSGAAGKTVFLFPAGAALALASLVLTVRRRKRLGAALVLGIAGAGLLPLLLLELSLRVARPALTQLHSALGEPRAVLGDDLGPTFSPTFASDTASWYGPAGLVLLACSPVAGVRLVRRRELPRTAIVAALALPATLLLAALTLTYHPWQGRFFLFAVGCSASLWGLALRRPALAWPILGVAALTALLSLANSGEKPSGLPFTAWGASIWSMTRAEAQSIYAPPSLPLLAYADTRMPRDARVALALGNNDFGYPFFGPRLERSVSLVPFGSDGRDADADWLVASAERAREIPRGCWAQRVATEEGAVFERRRGCP